MILVTVGIVTLTLAEGAQKSKFSAPSASCISCGNVVENITSPAVMQNITTTGIFEMYSEMMAIPFMRWLCGIAMLTLALFLSSGLGHLQVVILLA